MKRKTKIWLVILAVFIILVGWFVYKQWNTITAFIDSFRYSQEDVAKKLAENKEDLQEFINESEDITVRDLTEEEEKALHTGNLSEEEVIEMLTGKPPATPAPSESPGAPPTEKPVKTPTPTQTKVPEPTEKTSGEKIAETIARLYVQKSVYLNKLDVVEQHVRDYYDSLNIKGDKERRKKVKQQVLNEFLPVVASWEAECDTAVYSIINEIRAEPKKSGQDEAVADKIESAYLEEKRLKKTYFINRYMD